MPTRILRRLSFEYGACVCVCELVWCVRGVCSSRSIVYDRAEMAAHKQAQKKQPNQLQFYMIKYFLRTNTHTHTRALTSAEKSNKTRQWVTAERTGRSIELNQWKVK